MGPAAAPLPAAAAKIAVAQICLSAGYDAAESPALRAFADIAAKYISAAGKAAAEIANSRNRTHSNLIDIAVAIEHISLPRGFPGASQPGAPILRSNSGPLKGIIDFIASVEEIPFARPVRRWREIGDFGSPKPSFYHLQLDPPFSSVPRWLPWFPDDWVPLKSRELRKRREFGWNSEGEVGRVTSAGVVSFSVARPLAQDRKKVKFVICRRVGRKADVIEGERERKKLKISSSPSRMTPLLMGTRLEPVPC